MPTQLPFPTEGALCSVKPVGTRLFLVPQMQGQASLGPSVSSQTLTGPELSHLVPGSSKSLPGQASLILSTLRDPAFGFCVNPPRIKLQYSCSSWKV